MGLGFTLILLPVALAAGFLAGYFIRRNASPTVNGRDQVFQTIHRNIMELYGNVTSLLNVEKIITSFFQSLTRIPFVQDAWLLRYDGTAFVDGLTREPVESPELNEFARNNFFNPDGDDYIEPDRNSVLYRLYERGGKSSEGITVQVFPLVYDFLGTSYLFIVFLTKPNPDSQLSKFLLFLKRQLFLLLYLKELSFKYKASQEFLEGVFHNNPVAICITDYNGEVQRGNKEFYRIFLKSFQNIRNLIDDESFQALADGRTLEKDFHFDQKNLKVRGIPLYEMNGTVKGFLLTVTDDSLQHLLYKRLESSEERYRKLLKELPLGLIIVNQEGIIYFVNDNFMYSLGYSVPEKLQGRSLEEFFDLPTGSFVDIIKQIEKKDYLYFKFQSKNRYGSRIFSVNLRKLYIGSDNLIEAAFQDVTLENALYAQLEEKNKLIEEELSTARAVWEHILSIPPLYSSALRFETFYKASYQLGGDFYDVIQIDDVHVAIVIADASGHGVSASLVASMLKILVEFAPKDPHKISDMVDYINTGLVKILPEDQYITMFYGVIDTTNYTMEYVNCGHPFPLVHDDRTGEVTMLPGMSFPLGTSANFSYEGDLKKVQLPAACKILLYTDGIITFKKNNSLLNTEDLKQYFKTGLQLQTKDMLNDIYTRIIRECNTISDDDISMLLLVLNRNLAYKKFLSIPSNVLEIDYAIMKIKEGIGLIHSLGEEDSWKIYTSLYEALINAVEHGNRFNVQKRVTVIYRIVKNWIVFKVRDEGTGFDVKKVPNPLEEANLLKPSGRGVFMIRKLMNKIKYNKTGNETTMFFRVSGK